jgi:hypothetical protein
MDRPQLSAHEAVLQAEKTAETYLLAALSLSRRFLDEEQRTPEMLAALVTAQATDFHACTLMDSLHEIADAIREAAAADYFCGVVDAVGDAAKRVEQGLDDVAEAIRWQGE